MCSKYMVRNYPRGANFLKKAFHWFFTTDTIQWFTERGVTLKQEEDGRMFPVSDSSQTIIDCLMHEVNRHGVEIRMKSEVSSIKYEEGRFTIGLAGLGPQTSDFICVACGGFSKETMFDWLKRTGHSIEKPLPSLFTFNLPGDPVTKLMGVSVPDAQVKISGTKYSERGPVLITHWGISGPAVLRLSARAAVELSEAEYLFSVTVHWIPEFSEPELREKFQRLRFELASAMIINKNPFRLPQRLWEHLSGISGIGNNMRWADLPGKEQNIFIKNLCVQSFQVKGKTTFKEEFVTAGGIRLPEIDANTMQSKIVPGLFFAGEVMDVDGITGGFNFQQAWTSGWIAAKAIASL